MLELIVTSSVLGIWPTDFINPVPEQPPGTEKISVILNWISWGVIAVGLAGFLVSAGSLAFAALNGREMNGAKGLVISIVVCILAVSAGMIIQVFV